MNDHDSLLFTESFDHLLAIAQDCDLDLKGAYFTFDSAFDSQDNKIEISSNDFVPVIKPNPRNTKDLQKLHEKLEEFEPLEEIYKERYKIERVFAWEDKYRKTVIRYEKLAETYLGFKYLAYSLINLRWFIGKK